MKYRKLLLILIIFLGAFLRLYKLDAIPPGVNRDEASIGYTAYSLIKTGNDEYGKHLPLSFQSFGDWKLPLYIYTTIPFVKILGMNEIAVRFPSALAGIATIAITYFLVFELFRSYSLSLITSLLISLSPWHIHFSRVESESNVAVMFTALGLLLFLKGLKRNWLFPISAIFLSLPYYTYHGNHVTSTLLIIGLIAIYRKRIPIHIITFLSALILLVLPGYILLQTLTSADKTKISGISIFGDPAVLYNKIDVPRNQMGNTLIAKLFYNKVTYALITVSTNYLKSFGPEFLFIKGGTNHAHNIQNFGNLYLVELPFFYLGIIYLVKKRNAFLLWWLLIAPIAAAITKDAPHSNRMFAIFPLPPTLTALGIVWILHKRNKLIYLVTFAFLFNIFVYFNRYFVEFPKNEAQYWGIEYKKLNAILQEPQNKNKHVIISHPEYSPYIYLLFYSGFDPLTYQKTAVRYAPTVDSFVHVKSFDRFEFREIQWDTDIRKSNIILIDYTQFLPGQIKAGNYQKKEILLPNGQSFLTVIPT